MSLRSHKTVEIMVYLLLCFYYAGRVLNSVPNIGDILIRIRILEFVLRTTDPGPALLGSGFQDANKNKVFLLISYCRYINISLQRKHVIEKSQNSRNHGLSLFFGLLMEGSGITDAQKHWFSMSQSYLLPPSK